MGSVDFMEEYSEGGVSGIEKISRNVPQIMKNGCRNLGVMGLGPSEVLSKEDSPIPSLITRPFNGKTKKGRRRKKTVEVVKLREEEFVPSRRKRQDSEVEFEDDHGRKKLHVQLNYQTEISVEAVLTVPLGSIKILRWNSSGLGTHVEFLRDLVKKEALDILFLQETKLKARQMNQSKFQIGFQNCFVVDCEGRSGGLAMLWKYEIDLTVLSFSKFHVDAKITVDVVNNLEWFLTSVYGCPYTSHRWETWNLIKSLCHREEKAWLVFGDFNEILTLSEKCGVRNRDEKQMEDVRIREGNEGISESLDCLMANSKWWDLFPNMSATHSVVAYSDHLPLWIDTDEGLVYNFGKKLFRFEAMWVGDKECANIIEKGWNNVGGPNSLYEIMGKVSKCAEDLTLWNQSRFGNVQKELHNVKLRLKELQDADPTFLKVSEQQLARAEVQKWLERDEIMWQQRSRALWLKEGDKNFKFSHSKATIRRKKNKILRLQDDLGSWKKGLRWMLS
ncbi:uncharacterized protein LOC121255085 [Juglans microcarpa x Juglans regia]|uniref:uncharacterized protein LOC121255085 n=1 Tax=Juglans microcarpa x Juglans regia TaxID=2249226 RepID=UPI001B7E2546|nr:uncharacterized protein LOC121255085 [Juglans microcarpa x Juglans regia]